MSLSQRKGFSLTQRLDGISVPGSESIYAASTSPRDKYLVHSLQNEGQPEPLIFQKGEHGNDIVNDAWLLQGPREAGSEGSCGEFLGPLGICLQLASYIPSWKQTWCVLTPSPLSNRGPPSVPV